MEIEFPNSLNEYIKETVTVSITYSILDKKYRVDFEKSDTSYHSIADKYSHGHGNTIEEAIQDFIKKVIE